MRNNPPAPTLEQLRLGHPWTWVVCERCKRRWPVALVPLIIRWGPEASSDLLRRSAHCTRCVPREQACSIRLGLGWTSGGRRCLLSRRASPRRCDNYPDDALRNPDSNKDYDARALAHVVKGILDQAGLKFGNEGRLL
jgi:hypothetical protein